MLARRHLLILASSLALGSCGFRPLYRRPSPDGFSPLDSLASVRIAPLTDRTGQIFHNLLRNRLNPRGQPAQPSYVLSVSLSETVQELGLRADETATRANLRLRALFVLRASDDARVLFRGSARSISSYNILENQFATGVSEDDARQRGLRQLSDEIRERLAVFFLHGRQTARL